jgi:4-amino-4-deoxy-L-arabinose transferase-like glycosyltransferase
MLGPRLTSLSPARLVGLLAVSQVLVWTLAPALTHSSPPLDVVEGYMWGREWVIATYKHPAMPGWILEISRILTGAVGWPAYLASQVCVTSAFLLVFLLGRDLLGAEAGAAATFLLIGVGYYAWPTPEFNHNVLQLPFWAGLPLALWRAVDRRSLTYWLIAAACGAGGLYAKFSMALLLVAAAGWILYDPRSRRALASPAPWIGLVLFLVMIAPLVSWLVAHDFLPLHYAASRAAQYKHESVGIFLLNVLLNLSGAVVMLAIAGLIGPWARSAANPKFPLQAPHSLDTRALQFLLVFTVAPLALAMLGAVIMGSNLRGAWGSPMFNFIGLLVIALTFDRFGPKALKRIILSTAVVLAVVPVGYALVVLFKLPLTDRPLRVNWPQGEISERMRGIWARETHHPLRIVSGDDWIAGLVGLTAKDEPSIYTEGNRVLSPWITPKRLEGEGMLIVWDAQTNRIPHDLRSLVASQPARQERFTWPLSASGPDLVIGYAIIAPNQRPN